jgi:Ni/Co efflux regulator RcnB
MLIKHLVSRFALGAVLLAAGAALPAVAHAHDGEYRDRSDHQDHNDGDRWGHPNDEHRWENRHHWDQRDSYRNEARVYDRHHVEPYYAAPRVYYAPPVYYAPAYAYPQPDEGVTIFYRNRW